MGAMLIKNKIKDTTNKTNAHKAQAGFWLTGLYFPHAQVQAHFKKKAMRYRTPLLILPITESEKCVDEMSFLLKYCTTEADPESLNIP